MPQNPTLIAGILITAAIVLSGFLNKEETRYGLSAAEGQTVWRIDTRTGRVSMCGNMISGAGFSQIDMQQTAALMKLTKDSPKETSDKALQDLQNLGNMSQPRCTEWSSAALN